MFEKEELVLIHKSISELTIKGSDSHVVSVLLNKVAAEHAKPEIPNKNNSLKEKSK
jgi:hypothetical protein|tara:strand:- start:673 stop:840 length:168 start_codon:yes stop_codon:yes gene_type:complete